MPVEGNDTSRAESDQETPSPAPSHFTPMIRALRHPNYRLFFAGQGISLVGTWMQRIALQWLIYRLTGSAFWLGLAGFASQEPLCQVPPLLVLGVVLKAAICARVEAS